MMAQEKHEKPPMHYVNLPYQFKTSSTLEKKQLESYIKRPQESQVVGGGIKRLAPTIGLNVAKLDGRKPRAARDLTGTVPRPPTACPP